MKWVVAVQLLILTCGCTDISSISPAKTSEPDIPITTNFEECAKYYPVMESYPMQCRDPVAERTFTQKIDGPECNYGDVITSICPDGINSYQDSNCVDGEWQQVMYIRNPCEAFE